MIRAFNADLPYDRFVVEQIAGDLLESPRRHPAEGFNESILGTGFYFLGEGTHSPVDVREEQMRRIDNQIDVISKTFLGLTVACARCHDHKFDPITSNDYYALAGFLRSSRHQQAFIDRPRADRRGEPSGCASSRQTIAAAARRTPGRSSAVAPGGRCAASGSRAAGRAGRRAHEPDEIVFEDFNRDSFDGWFVTGDAFGDRPSRPGDLRLDLGGRGRALVPVEPGLAHSGLVSDRLRGVLRSRSFTIEARYIHWLVAGRGGRINVVVDGFEKIRDPIYGGLTTDDQCRRPAALGHAGRGHVAGPFGLPRDRDGATVDFDGANDTDRRRPRLHRGRRDPDVESARAGCITAPTAAGDATAVALDLDAVDRGPAEGRTLRLADRLAAAVDELRAIESRLAEPTLGPGDRRRDRRGRAHPHPRQSQEPGRGRPPAVPGSSGRLGLVHPRRGQRPARAGAADGRPGGQSAAAARAGQPALEAPLRRGDRQDRPTTSARWGGSPAIPSCSTGWPPSSSAAAGRSRRCTG